MAEVALSGILAIFHLDGSPLDPGLLGRLTGAMAYRGADERGCWSEGGVGLGFAGLHAFDDHGDRGQPASLEGRYWIVADARIDRQAELRDELRIAPDQRLTDAELVLHAYRRWGHGCPAHLLGDFAFLLWDAAERRLFAACDQAGIRHLYWSRAGKTLLVSDSFRTLVSHGGVSREPDARLLADFIEYGRVLDPEATGLEHVKHLPPAGALVADQSGIRSVPYWKPTPVERLRMMRDEEVIERFRDVLLAALRDRLRCRSVSLLMSGGMDSTAIAALAVELGVRVSAVTVSHAPEVDDREELRLAHLTAEHLGIPLEVVAGSREPLFGGMDDVPLTPWPLWGSLPSLARRIVHGMLAPSRLGLSGFDGDMAVGLSSVSEYLSASGSAFAAVEGLGTYVLYEGRLPVLRALRTRFSAPSAGPGIGFVRRRSGRVMGTDRVGPEVWPLGGVAWRELMEDYDSMWSGALLNAHPFADLRVIEFGRSLPPVPWRVQKRVLRAAMKGILPQEVLERLKSPLPADPVEVKFQRDGLRGLNPREAHPLLREMVDWEAFERARGSREAGASFPVTSVLLAQKWLSLVG